MSELRACQPMQGCRVVTHDGAALVFGQPPEVLKALLKREVPSLRGLVLPDIRERSDVLVNNVEFLLYYFLFLDRGLERGRRLKLIGEDAHIAQVLELLRLSLLGPARDELRAWGTERELARDWLNSGAFFALKDERGAVRPVSSFFEVHPFRQGRAAFDGIEIRGHGNDRFTVSAATGSMEVDLGRDLAVQPPYPVPADYVPSGLTKFGVEVLGGASGFSAEAPSTGFALCFNGKYVLIDAIPYLDAHLRARGISKNQIHAVFLTHIHDDHCNIFPLLLMPRRLDLITTREVFQMAIRKLAMGIGWKPEVVAEHFNFVEVKVGETLNYYGLEIVPHHTVHSIPTVGAVFRATRLGHRSEICLVGDIQTFADIAEMRRQGLVRPETEARLHRLYRDRFDLLIADGGMGPIHGDPADALHSKSERVVFVHLDALPEAFDATFSIATAGKRYTILDGDGDLYTTQTIELLTANFDGPFASRWLGTLFADKVLKRYNADDVIIKQGAETWGKVFLILSGYCEVIHHDGTRFTSLGTREAGDLMGEMAVVTGRQIRNASVLARTPVIVCEFSERTFNAFLEEQGLKESLLARWARRPWVAAAPMFAGLSTTVIDAVCGSAEDYELATGARIEVGSAAAGTTVSWDIVCSGSLVDLADGSCVGAGTEIGGYRPLAPLVAARYRVRVPARVLRIARETIDGLLTRIPELSYRLRKYRAAEPGGDVSWRLGPVPVVDARGYASDGLSDAGAGPAALPGAVGRRA